MQVTAAMRRFLFVVLSLCCACAIAAKPEEKGKAEHVVLMVWDGMRPDFITPEKAPTLAALARDGVFFRNHHAAFPASTNVNGAVLATGVYPQRNGVISNEEFRAEVNPHDPFDTSDFPALSDTDGRINQRFIEVPTIADLVQGAGFRTAIAGSKPIAQLFDRHRSRTSPAARDSRVVYRGRFLPVDAATTITQTIGPFPKRKGYPNNGEDAWTTRALTDVLWKNDVPKFSLLWLSEPDLSQHETAPGSPTSLAAIRSCDDNLAEVLAALKAKGALATTDIFVVSDHGFSTINLAIDAAARLRSAGFDAVRQFPDDPKPGQILVVSLGGSMALYVAGHEPETIRRVVDYLQHSEFAGVIATRQGLSGTFTLGQLHIDIPTAPDVFVAARWEDQPNEFGVQGQIASDLGRKVGQGTHTTMSPFDFHNTLITSGPDFRRSWSDEVPTGNIDVAPTILWLLGLPAPQALDGRVLKEALRTFANTPTVLTGALTAERQLDESTWCQTVRTATVEKTTYFMEGNGGIAKGEEYSPNESHGDKAPHTPGRSDRR